MFSGDTVNLDTGGATGTFASQNVGTGITVTVAGLTIGGAQASDYTLTQPTTTANITPATPTVSVSDSGGTYNGSAFNATASVTGVGGQAAARTRGHRTHARVLRRQHRDRHAALRRPDRCRHLHRRRQLPRQCRLPRQPLGAGHLHHRQGHAHGKRHRLRRHSTTAPHSAPPPPLTGVGRPRRLGTRGRRSHVRVLRRQHRDRHAARRRTRSMPAPTPSSPTSPAAPTTRRPNRRRSPSSSAREPRRSR